MTQTPGPNPNQPEQPGLDPSPNPKVVVKAVNPPVTPDQVVSMAEIPEAATIELPKIQNIKIAPVKNKTIQGHLKAIEAKMVATEKLMKDIVKLQKVQIHTEKELFERKRELYQNTFEEYLLDKTIDFEDPDNPDCTCINLPKKPKPGGGGFFIKPPKKPKGRKGRAQEAREKRERLEDIKVPEVKPETAPSPSPGPIKFPPILPPIPLPRFPDLGLPGVATLPADPLENFLETGEMDPVSAQKAPALDGSTPQPVSPTPTAQAPNIFETIKRFQDAMDSNPVVQTIDKATQPLADNLNAAMNDPMVSFALGGGGGAFAQQGLKAIPFLARMFPKQYLRFFARAPKVAAPAPAPAPASAAAPPAPAGPSIPLTPPASGPAVPANIFQQGTQGLRSMVGKMTDRVLTSRIMEDPRMNEAFMKFLRSSQKFAKRGYDIRGAQNIDDVVNLTGGTKDQFVRSNIKEFRRYINTRQVRPITPAKNPIVKKRNPTNKSALELFEQSVPEITKGAVDPLKKLGKTPKKASGGIGTTELYQSDAKQYFKNISNNIDIPKFGGGGFMGWFNKGLNARFPNESTVRFGNPLDYFSKNPDPTTLFGDDALQRGQSNKNFKAGKKPSVFGRPDRAVFGRDLLDWHRKPSRLNPMGLPRPRYVPGELGGPASAPTPVQREIVKRPIRAMRSNVQHPLWLALDFIVNDLFLNPRSTAVYDQVTGPNAYYNDPAYKGPMPSQNLENAQNSMMSGNTDQKPEIVPLPPDYIKIPGKNKAPDFIGNDSPDIEMKPSIFSRSSTHID